MELRVRHLRGRGIDLPLPRPVETAAGVMRTAPLALIDLVTEEGITGRSYLRAYIPVALKPLVQLVTNSKPSSEARSRTPLPFRKRSTGTSAWWVPKA